MLAHTPLQESKAQRTLGDWSNFPDNPRKAAGQYPWDIWDSAQLNCQRTGAYSKVRRSRICLLSMISPSAMPPYALHTLVIPKCIHSAISVTYSFNQPVLPWLSFRCLKFNMSKIKLSLYPFKQQQQKKKLHTNTSFLISKEGIFSWIILYLSVFPGNPPSSISATQEGNIRVCKLGGSLRFLEDSQGTWAVGVLSYPPISWISYPSSAVQDKDR